MLLEELKQTQKGTYAAFRLDEASKDKIEQFCVDHDIPNAVPRDKLHTTLLYSRKHLPEYQPAGNMPSAYIGIPNGLDVWESQPKADGSTTHALVLKLDSPEMVERHNFLMGKHEGTYDYPSYNPHVTMSYDIDGVDTSALDASGIGELSFDEEYGEDLDLEWSDSI